MRTCVHTHTHKYCWKFGIKFSCVTFYHKLLMLVWFVALCVTNQCVIAVKVLYMAGHSGTCCPPLVMVCCHYCTPGLACWCWKAFCLSKCGNRLWIDRLAPTSLMHIYTTPHNTITYRCSYIHSLAVISADNVNTNTTVTLLTSSSNSTGNSTLSPTPTPTPTTVPTGPFWWQGIAFFLQNLFIFLRYELLMWHILSQHNSI